MGEPCAFCAIVAGDAPAHIVREWDDALAIVPLNPVVAGHTLVLPRRHVVSFFSDPETSAATMRRAAELVHGVERHIDPHDYNVITSAGRAATQTVFHLHVHLVPRSAGDGIQLPWSSSSLASTTAERDALREQVQRLEDENAELAGYVGMLSAEVADDADQP